MAGLGDLVVNLSANTQKFDKNISKSQTGLKSFGTAAMSALNPVTAALTAMAAGAVGVGAAVWGLQNRIGTLAGVADKAAQTGLSGAFLQQLEFAADQSGVSAETLTGGIKKLTIAVGSGSKAFAEIGLNLADLQRVSPEQQFLKVAEAISKLPTASDRAAAAVKVFGKSGIEMTGLFAGGLDDITKLMQDARDIGIGLDDKQLAQIAAADDSLQKMYASISAMVDQVAVGLAPAFEAVSEKVTGLIGPVTELFDTFNNLDDKWTWAGDTLVAAFDVAMETIKAHWKEMIADLLVGTAKFGMDIADFSLDMTNPGAMVMRGIDMAQNAGAMQGGENNGLQAAQDRLAGLMGKFQGAADENKQPNQNVEPRFEGNTAAIQNLNAVYAEWDKLAAERKSASDKLISVANDKLATDEQLIAAHDALKTAEAALNKMATETVPAAHKAVAQQKFNDGISSVFSGFKQSVSGGMLGEIGMAAGGMLDRAKIQTGAMGGMLEGWLSSFDDKKNQRELKPQLAGAMQAGSVEAYSTLVQAMMTRGKDPVVAATEKQTKDLIQGLKPKREFKNIESFVSL